MPESLVSNVRVEVFLLHALEISGDQKRDDHRYEYIEDHSGPSDPSGRKHLTSSPQPQYSRLVLVVKVGVVDQWDGSTQRGQFLVLG